MIDHDDRIADAMRDWLATSCPGWAPNVPIPDDLASVFAIIRRLEVDLAWLWAMGFDVRDYLNALANLRGKCTFDHEADEAIARVRSTQRLYELRIQGVSN
ncbi:MAG TPA: hypothetical protein VK540_15890 [Polyangiaceae bacterium]|nr:hypothetical protein [Polyangiaceae bacterium]